MYRILFKLHTEQQIPGVSILCMTGLMENLIISNKFLILCTLEFKPHRELYDWFRSTPCIERFTTLSKRIRSFKLSYTVTSNVNSLN